MNYIWDRLEKVCINLFCIGLAIIMILLFVLSQEIKGLAIQINWLKQEIMLTNLEMSKVWNELDETNGQEAKDRTFCRTDGAAIDNMVKSR